MSGQLKPAKYLPQLFNLDLIRRLVNGVKIDKDTGCWIWKGCKHHKDGYGQIWYDGKARQVHRVSYAIFNGEIPDGMTVDHTCFNPACCNPEHLTLMTHSENCQRKNDRSGID